MALPGLTDAEHTDAQGNHVSTARAIDGTGLVFGSSLRVSPAPAGPADHGVTGWVYDPDTGVTTRAALDAVPYAPLDQICINGVSDTTALGFGLGGTTCGDITFPRYVWAFDSHDRVRTIVGLSDPDHTNPADGNVLNQLLPYSLGGRISPSGHIAGSTTRWQPSLGTSVWVYDSTSPQTTRIGLFDSQHTAGDGSQNSHPSLLSEAGNVAGFSERYIDGVWTNYTPWIHLSSTGVTRRVGFYDGDGRGSTGFTHADGHQESGLSVLTDSAYAAGSSARFQGSELFGTVAWRYRIADDSMVSLGLADPIHTRSNGSRDSAVTSANDSGDVLGTSTRYDGGTDPLSVTAWIFDGESLATHMIGLFDAAHTSAEGLQTNMPHVLSESGHVAGTAIRFSSSTPTTEQGSSVWIARAGDPVTKRIGLIDSATLGAATFSTSSGEQHSVFSALFESGDVVGLSSAFLADSPLGSATWYYDASTETTRPIGLYGLRFTVSDNSFTSYPTHWTESGFVAGAATGSDQYPVLWIYSAQSDVVSEIAPPNPPAGVPVFPEILFLADSGWVVGRFTFFDGSSLDGTRRFFVWTPEGGTVYLDERIDHGFEAAGWVGIETIESVSGDRIVGSGRRSNGDVDGLMLVALPEPSQALLVSMGCLAAVARVARRSRKRPSILE
ncbi:MAG: hypothetical protein IPK00_12695 [Deltaproteobacteria bacterium]|nr:hypothetical protein [Deltaproteobacteria bacterium]